MLSLVNILNHQYHTQIVNLIPCFFRTLNEIQILTSSINSMTFNENSDRYLIGKVAKRKTHDTDPSSSVITCENSLITSFLIPI